MPPKQTQQKSDRLQKEVISQSNTLKNMKKIINTEEAYLNDIAALQTYFEEQSTPSNRKKPLIKVKQQNQQENKSCQNDFQQVQCLACLQDHFDEGKYILDCRHTFCNYCFKYWSNLSNKCPACHKKSNSVMMILNGSTRVQAISPKYMHQNCEICNKNYNEHQIYYCDSCNENCVHIYCEPELMNQKGEQFWVCKKCKKQNMKLRGKTRNNFEYVDESNNFEDTSDSECTFARTRKQKGKERPVLKDQKKDKNRKNRGKTTK